MPAYKALIFIFFSQPKNTAQPTSPQPHKGENEKQICFGSIFARVHSKPLLLFILPCVSVWLRCNNYPPTGAAYECVLSISCLCVNPEIGPLENLESRGEGFSLDHRLLRVHAHECDASQYKESRRPLECFFFSSLNHQAATLLSLPPTHPLTLFLLS